MKDITSVIKDNMLEYSKYVISSRALPCVEDGLKPIHRKVLYSMYRDKSTKLTKSANVTGSVMKFSPHGDSYPSLVLMVQEDRHINPFVEGKGNFAQKTSRDLAPAASRYSEVKLSKLAIDSMMNFDKNIVDFVPNYDGTLTMPVHLPVRFPNILTMQNEGIGVGMASNIPSFNMIEVCKATIKYIEKGKHTNLVPDFATRGNILIEETELKKINLTGKGSFKLRSNYKIISRNQLEITEIPFNTTREQIIEKIIELTKNGKLQVSNVQDLTGLKGQSIVITTKRGTTAEQIIEQLYTLTPMETTYSTNMNILADGLPVVLGVHDIIEKWVIWRRNCIKRGLQHDIDTFVKKLHLLYGLRKILVNLDTVIEIIRFEDEDKIDSVLMETFDLDEEQAKEISKLKLRDISTKSIEKKTNEIEELERKKELYILIANSEDHLNQIVVKGLNETIKNFGKKRHTKIVK